MKTIVLPWPSRLLHPNARTHWSSRAKAARQARESAAWATIAVGLGPWVHDGPIVVSVAFCPPDRRRRDLDGCLSSLKSALDGIADALVVDDSRFEFSLRMAEPFKGGRVEVWIA